MKTSIPNHSLPVQLIVAAVLTAMVIAAAYFLSTAGAQPVRSVVAAPPAGVISYAADAPQLAAIVVAPVRFEAIPVLALQPGRVAYDENQTTRISSPIAGRVLSAPVEIGDQVRAGQILAQLDAPDLATAEADWQKARADDVRKQRAFERTKQLFDAEVVARKDFEGAEAEVRQARSETRRTSLRMRNLSASGGQNGVYNLKASLAGVVTERQINKGQEIRPDLPAPLFVITDLDHLWVIVDVPEQAAALLHAGQRAMVDSEAWPGVAFAASVERVGLLLDAGTRRVQVRCRVQNQERKLKPEMFARVSFLSQGSDRQGVVLPNTSLFIEGRYSHVFVQTHPGTFERRRVHVRNTERDRSFIDSGLAAGEAVVTEGAFLLTTEVGVNAH